MLPVVRRNNSRSSTGIAEALNESICTPKSPFQRVNDGRITKNNKKGLLENLELELNDRSRKLRSLYTQHSKGLKHRIEMRLNRIPKKLWKMRMGDLLAQVEGSNVASSIGIGGAREFVEDVRRLSCEEPGEGKEGRLMIPKKRVAKNTGASERKQIPPPGLPTPSNPLGHLSRPNISSSPMQSSPSQRSSPQRASSPIKLSKGTRTRKITVNMSSNSRPTSRATTRSSTETAGTCVSAGMRGTKSSQAKAKAAAAVADANLKGLKRGGVKGTGSNGSLKENRVAGVKKEITGKATGTGRVLRSRK